MNRIIIIIAIFFFLFSKFSQDYRTAFQPGVVYKEFHVLSNSSSWRVTDPNSGHQGAQEFLPNPILNFTIDDLEFAIKAEVEIDLWGGHVGTSNKRFKINNNPWITIPKINTTPTNSDWYLHQYNSIVEIPLSYLVEGLNTLEGTSGNQTKYGWNWGQWGWYGIIIRVFYDPDLKSHTTFEISSPNNNSILTGNPTISFSNISGGYKSIDVVGYFLGYDNSGIGNWNNWHYNFHRENFSANRLNIKGHIGTAHYPSNTLIWNSAWYPDQPANSIKLIARIRDSSDIYYVCQPRENLTLRRNTVSYVLAIPYNVPENYWVRAGQTKSSSIFVPTLKFVAEARFLIRTWNGRNSDFNPGSYRINGTQINSSYFGKKDFYGFTFATFNPNVLRLFKNTISVYSNDPDHGIEILWPGPAVMLRYNVSNPVIVYQPMTAFVNLGDSAVFSITVLGAPPLNYQWKFNGQNIGNNSSRLVLYNLDYSNLGNEIQCVVTNHLGTVVSEKAFISMNEFNTRTKFNNVVYYDFRNISSNKIFDKSLHTEKIDLIIEDTLAVEKYQDFLRIKSPTRIRSLSSASKIIQSVKRTNEITIEMWIRPANLTQNGPARIVTISDSLFNSNITIGQGTGSGTLDRLQIRLRTESFDTNGSPVLNTNGGTLNIVQPSHIVYTRNQRGNEAIYINGILVSSRTTLLGDLSNWSDNYFLSIGNEINAQRPWLGDIYMLSIYNRALNLNEVLHHYNLGFQNLELPVNLASFTAEYHSSKIVLKWKTVQEINNYGFEIQRSISEDESFSTIGFLKERETLRLKIFTFTKTKTFLKLMVIFIIG